MIKPIALIALLMGLAPVVACADPMSFGGEGNLIAANNAAASVTGAGEAIVGTEDAGGDDDVVREPLATPEPATPRGARQPAGTSNHPARTPTHATNPTHKKTEATRWQSLLPGVMK